MCQYDESRLYPIYLQIVLNKKVSVIFLISTMVVFLLKRQRTFACIMHPTYIGPIFIATRCRSIRIPVRLKVKRVLIMRGGELVLYIECNANSATLISAGNDIEGSSKYEEHPHGL